MIEKYEFHLKTKKNFSELMKAMQDKGMVCTLYLMEDSEWVKMYISAGKESIKAYIKLYKDHDRMYEYEISTRMKDDFTKLHDAMIGM